MNRTNEQKAMRVSAVGIAFDILILTPLKLIAGIVGGSTAMLADAAHSLSDMLTTVIAMIGVKLANRKADKSHPYGHERFECVAAILVSIALAVTGIGIGWTGIRHIVSVDLSDGIDMGTPGLIALIAAAATIIVTEGMFWYKRRVAKSINSGALMADAWHHRADALSSVASFIGVFIARQGFPIFDPLAAIVICPLILKAALDIFRDALGKMTDKACDEATEQQMRDVIDAFDKVRGIDELKTRLFGDKIYVDVEISIDGEHTLHESHAVAQDVHDAIEATFSAVKHCMVHVNPHATNIAGTPISTAQLPPD
ncbi:MAG: cation diffusion facilitator family transporter [Oscillospiraceae bacterium]|nr:cation diffusion facilitator family transporter [Oscillospiraceae bacterium]